MTGEFPALSHVFVKERDMFLAHSLRRAAAPLLNPPQREDGESSEILLNHYLNDEDSVAYLPGDCEKGVGRNCLK